MQPSQDRSDDLGKLLRADRLVWGRSDMSGRSFAFQVSMKRICAARTRERSRLITERTAHINRIIATVCARHSRHQREGALQDACGQAGDREDGPCLHDCSRDNTPRSTDWGSSTADCSLP